MSNQARKRRKFVLVAAAVLVIAACSKLTPENYARLKVGMAYSEVVQIVGKPSDCSAVLNAQNCRWKDGDKELQINFVAEKAIFLSSKGL